MVSSVHDRSTGAVAPLMQNERMLWDFQLVKRVRAGSENLFFMLLTNHNFEFFAF